MKPKHCKVFTSLILACLMIVLPITGCNTNWITAAQAVVSVAGPAVANLLPLFLGAGATQSVDVQVKQVQVDLNLIGSILSQWNAANATTNEQKINAAVADIQANLGPILSAAHVKDQASANKITALVGLISGEIQSLEGYLPSTASQLKLSASTAKPLKADQFKAAYNAIMLKPTGNSALDGQIGALSLK